MRVKEKMVCLRFNPLVIEYSKRMSIPGETSLGIVLIPGKVYDITIDYIKGAYHDESFKQKSFMSDNGFSYLINDIVNNAIITSVGEIAKFVTLEEWRDLQLEKILV